MEEKKQDKEGVVRYGMKLSSLTTEVLGRIVDLYTQTVGGEGSELFAEHPERELPYVRKMLGTSNVVEWRFGSRLTPHSKLYIYRDRRETDGDQIIKFSFFPNIPSDRISSEQKSESEKLKEEFRQRVEKYLEETNLSVPLSY